MPDDLVEVDDEDDLYRHVFPYWVLADETISSSAFKDRRKHPLNRFSVDVARLTTPLESPGRGKPGQKLIALKARTPRGLGFRVWHEPEHGNYAHCNVEGRNDKNLCDLLAEGSWVVDVSEPARGGNPRS